jgi:hypothetical protein
LKLKHDVLFLKIEVKSSIEVLGALNLGFLMEHLHLFIGKVCGWFWRENVEV